VKRFQPDWKAIEVEMKLRLWNSNYVGTHYGGSLYSMADPFYMLMLIENLGSDYIVWDKSATIRFKKPGKGKVSAAFRLFDEQLEQIREALKRRRRSIASLRLKSRTNRERWSPRSKNPSRFDAWRLAVPQKSYSSVIATPDRIPNVTTAANTRADVLHDIVRPTISIG
jgi:Domain of unknown function (DUF4442)